MLVLGSLGQTFPKSLAQSALDSLASVEQGRCKNYCT